MVTAAEISSDPAQPKRLEKNRNIAVQRPVLREGCSVTRFLCGRALPGYAAVGDLTYAREQRRPECYQSHRRRRGVGEGAGAGAGGSISMTHSWSTTTIERTGRPAASREGR